ncbi:MAG: glycosyltransferase [Fretibacterium sp.]|nr:glycosyltransferase [Fretibacterium sp.]
MKKAKERGEVKKAEVKRAEALLIFSRLPVGVETKTRLAPLLDESCREQLHRCFWADIFASLLELRDRMDLFLCWTGSGAPETYSHLIPAEFQLREQRGASLGDRMFRAAQDAFESGYERVAIVGSDIPQLRPESVRRGFDALLRADVVLGPAYDGGYWFIGMKKAHPELFDLSVPWGGSEVRLGTLARMERLGCLYAETDAYRDIDTPDDLRAFLAEGHERGTATRAFLETLFHP